MWGEGGSRRSNWRKTRGPRTLSAEQMDKAKKKKVIIGLGVIGDIKAHIPASFLGCESKLDMVTNHHQNPRQELIIVKKQIRNSGRGMQVP